MAMSNFASSENTTTYSFKYNLHGNNDFQELRFSLSLTGNYFNSTISNILQFYFSQVTVVSKNGLLSYQTVRATTPNRKFFPVLEVLARSGSCAVTLSNLNGKELPERILINRIWKKIWILEF